MAGSIPPSTPSDGNLLALVVPAIADPTAPTVDELTAETVTDISCYLTPDGLQVTQDQATITDERLWSTQVLGRGGRKTFGLSLRGIDNTNSDLESEFNEFKIGRASCRERSKHHGSAGGWTGRRAA